MMDMMHIHSCFYIKSPVFLTLLVVITHYLMSQVEMARQVALPPHHSLYAATPECNLLSNATATPVHVVLSSGNKHFVGLQAVVNSMINNTQSPASLFVHLFVAEDIHNLEYWKRQVESQTGSHIVLHDFQPSDVEPYINPHLDKEEHTYRLRADSNFARFIMAERLANVSAALWMDSDMIVQGDIVAWVRRNTPADKPLAAFPRSKSDPYIPDSTYGTLYDRGIQVSKASPTFNAGILLMNLKLWREQKVDETIRKICQVNREQNLYPKSGSQAPLLLALGGDRFQHLNPQEYMDGLGGRPKPFSLLGKHAWVLPLVFPPEEYKWAKLPERAVFLHWNGKRKPWAHNGAHKQFWEPYAEDLVR
eukprot:CAMPEP_0172453434 /NCGR_PEP_ID=MMETSP1065-20121228/10758_1 /TAXON_ID=265537 /ORGANISM="Amphiprora paludosa, Strain CCMP125" /LENGTH=363 /DNA_ID=CAMNT_0013205615 /DNA_START=127 /DNA_END=1218 /DNA_ORIENTATION=+